MSKHQKRISGSILDRIDLYFDYFDVPRVPVQTLSSLSGGEPSSAIRQRVEAARAIQHARFASMRMSNMLVDGDMGPSEVQKSCQLDKEGVAILRMAVERMGLSARVYYRILKLGRTIADLAGSEGVQQAHLAEALPYRPRGIL